MTFTTLPHRGCISTFIRPIRHRWRSGDAWKRYQAGNRPTSASEAVDRDPNVTFLTARGAGQVDGLPLSVCQPSLLISRSRPCLPPTSPGHPGAEPVRHHRGFHCPADYPGDHQTGIPRSIFPLPGGDGQRWGRAVVGHALGDQRKEVRALERHRWGRANRRSRRGQCPGPANPPCVASRGAVPAVPRTLVGVGPGDGRRELGRRVAMERVAGDGHLVRSLSQWAGGPCARSRRCCC